MRQNWSSRKKRPQSSKRRCLNKVCSVCRLSSNSMELRMEVRKATRSKVATDFITSHRTLRRRLPCLQDLISCSSAAAFHQRTTIQWSCNKTWMNSEWMLAVTWQKQNKTWSASWLLMPCQSRQIKSQKMLHWPSLLSQKCQSMT